MGGQGNSGTARKLAPEELRWRCDPQSLPAGGTVECVPCSQVIGQPRAVKAIDLGLNVRSPGYNIFVSGFEGTGRMTTVRALLEQFERAGEQRPPDLCFANNFDQADRPRLLRLPAGAGRLLRDLLEELVESLAESVPAVLEGEEFHHEAEGLVGQHQEQERGLFRQFEEELKAGGFSLVQVKLGAVTQPMVAPLIDGKPVVPDQLEALVAQEVLTPQKSEELQARLLELNIRLGRLLKAARKVQKQMRRALIELKGKAVEPLVDGGVADIEEDPRLPGAEVGEYLKEVREFLIENVDRFLAAREGEAPSPRRQLTEALCPELRVNIAVDNTETKRPPIIEEIHPSFKNLMGTIEREPDGKGGWQTDFMQIRAGSLLQANGGYLILDALDLLTERGSYPALKRALRYRKLDIQHVDSLFFGGLPSLLPEPVDIRVKVLLLGPQEVHNLLYQADRDFQEVFKVKAEFDWVLERTPENVAGYLSVLRKIVDENGLLPFDRDATAAVLEQAARLAGRQDRLTAQFRRIANLAREASYFAAAATSPQVGRAHVEQAVRERRERLNLIEQKVHEQIADGSVRVELEGARVGQVNGLAVLQTNEYSFGKPSRITAETTLGTRGLINIEREAQLSGRTHDKGVLILAGYLQHTFARHVPLAVNATLCFEQSYSGVDGDSASSTEVYCVLSSLSGVPLRQDLAVTGSVDQKGQVQAIGGVNQKIEGFFDVCAAHGLSGSQGVLIPAANVPDLMLRPDVVEAVEQGRFQVYAVETIAQGILLLTGKPLGEPDGDAGFPEGTVGAAVVAQLARFAEQLKAFRQPLDG